MNVAAVIVAAVVIIAVIAFATFLERLNCLPIPFEEPSVLYPGEYLEPNIRQSGIYQ